MPTTTNFGWTTPADTDLVKDGAAAIRTLAGNIDTSLVDLKGGTTGQFLSKNSNTDLDFVFATPASGGMTLLSTTTLNAVTTTVSIGGGYNNLQIILRSPKVGSDGFDIRFRLNSDTGSNYRKIPWTTANGILGAGLLDDKLSPTASIDNSATANTSIIMNIFDYTQTTTQKIGNYIGLNYDSTTPTSYQYRSEQFNYQSTSAITDIVVYTTGALALTGTLLIYGVK